MSLAPMAVLPEYQNRGFGSELVKVGLSMLRQKNCPFVIVLGHPTYYPRFGFKPASQFNIRCQWNGVPDEAFMAILLNPAVMEGVSGTGRYREEFNDAI